MEIYPYDTLSYTYSYDTLGNLLKQSGPTKGEEDSWQYNDLNQMVSKHSCGYEQKITRIYDYGYTYDKRGNLVKEEKICSPTTIGPKNITIATYLYDETNRMVQGTNKNGEVSAYTFNGLGVRVGTEQILQDNSHGYTDFHCQTPSVETGIEKPEVVKTDYVIDYTHLDTDQRVLVKSEQDGYDFRYTYGLDKVKVYTTSEGSDWWGQNIHKCVNADYVHTDRLGSVVNLSDEHGRVTARTDYTDWGEVRKYTDITVDQGFRRLLPEITYATHEYDDVLNQFYAKARMYDAENKRFTAIDPILDPAGYDIRGYVTDPMMLVQYLYVKDNAVNRLDPHGLKTWGIGYGGEVALLLDASASVELVYDDKGNYGIAITYTLFGGGIGISKGASGSHSNAKTIFDLRGVSGKVTAGPFTVSMSADPGSNVIEVSGPLELLKSLTSSEILNIGAGAISALGQLPIMSGSMVRTRVIDLTGFFRSVQDFFEKLECSQRVQNLIKGLI